MKIKDDDILSFVPVYVLEKLGPWLDCIASDIDTITGTEIPGIVQPCYTISEYPWYRYIAKTPNKTIVPEKQLIAVVKARDVFSPSEKPSRQNLVETLFNGILDTKRNLIVYHRYRLLTIFSGEEVFCVVRNIPSDGSSQKVWVPLSQEEVLSLSNGVVPKGLKERVSIYDIAHMKNIKMEKEKIRAEKLSALNKLRGIVT